MSKTAGRQWHRQSDARSILGHIDAGAFLLLNLRVDPRHRRSQPVKLPQQATLASHINGICVSVRTKRVAGAQPSTCLIRALSELRPRTPSGPGM